MNDFDSLLVNGKIISVSYRGCFFCLDKDGMPLYHHGHFVCVPVRHLSIWKEKIEKSVLQKINNDSFLTAVYSFDARVAVVHISLDNNGNFDRTSPVFLPGTFKGCPTTFNKRPQSIALNMYQQIQQLDRQFEEAQQRLQSLWSKKAKLQQIVNSPHLSTNNVKFPNEHSGDLIEKSIPKGREHYNEVIRNRARELATKKMSLKDISEQIYHEFKIQPSRCSIRNFLREGSLHAKVNAVVTLSEMGGDAVLGVDESSSRHRSVFVMMGIGKSDAKQQRKSVTLGIRQIGGKDAENQLKEIQSILREIVELSSQLEATKNNPIISLQSFHHFGSDHIASNGVLYRLIKQKRQELNFIDQTPFDWIRCLLHKFDLVETHFLSTMTKQRADCSAKCGSPPLLSETLDGPDLLIYKTGGMKSSKSTKVNSAIDFLYRTSVILSESTKGEKTNWGFLFRKQMSAQGTPFSFHPINGSRLHIYSHSALRTYPILRNLRLFIEAQADSWTKRYLLEASLHPNTLSELRLLLVSLAMQLENRLQHTTIS